MSSSASSSHVSASEPSSSVERVPKEDIMSMLLTYEQKDVRAKIPGEADSDDDVDGVDVVANAYGIESNDLANEFRNESAMEVDEEGEKKLR